MSHLLLVIIGIIILAAVFLLVYSRNKYKVDKTADELAKELDKATQKAKDLEKKL